MPRSSLRFVLSRRWALFALVVIAAAYASWWLGGWQFHRLTDRKALNSVVRTNEARGVSPVTDVLAPRGPVSEDDEWRLVTATGTYDPEKSVVVRYRTREEGTGVDVVVPLVTADGTALLVDRGWLETNPQGTDRAAIPDPPSGEVTVTGWVRQDGTGSSTSVDDLSTRAINSTRIGEATGLSVFTGFVELDTESPGASSTQTPLLKVELPELDNGPHFFYGLQWWFFGLLAIFGFFYLMYDEWRHGPRGERLHRPQRPERPERPVRAARPAKPPSKAARRRELVRQAEERADAERDKEPQKQV